METVPVDTSFASKTFNTCYNELLESKYCLFNSLSMLQTDSSTGITISGGQIDNITSISNGSDIVNKGYVIGSKRPSGPTDSIQFNDNGIFNGSSKLLFNGTFASGTLITTDVGISDSVVIIGSKSIVNAPEPIYPTQLATKNYVDKYRNFTNSFTYDSSSSVTYTDITNSIILRSNVLLSSTSITDLVPTAVDIVKELTLTDISVNAASVGSLTLVGTQTVDGIVLLQNSTILVKNQSDLTTNGIYTVRISNWIKTSTLVNKRVYVNGGSVNGYLLYISNDNLTYKTIDVLPTMSYYSFDLINNSLDSTFIIGSNTGTTFTQLNPIIVYPTYVMNSTLYITALSPPAVSIDINSNGPDIKYLNSNFVNGTFQTNLSYKIDNTFMIPGPSTYVVSTSASQVYSQSDVSKNIIVRNPAGAASDGFADLLTQSIFTIQNISAFSVTLSGTNSLGNWVFKPNPIVITANKTCDVILYNTGGINYATSMGKKNF
jgi:hypothetical protein